MKRYTRTNAQVSAVDNRHRAQSAERSLEQQHVLVLQNKTPFWNEQSQVYQLDFGGRVTQESAKNFQIEHNEQQASKEATSTQMNKVIIAGDAVRSYRARRLHARFPSAFLRRASIRCRTRLNHSTPQMNACTCATQQHPFALSSTQHLHPATIVIVHSCTAATNKRFAHLIKVTSSRL